MLHKIIIINNNKIFKYKIKRKNKLKAINIKMQRKFNNNKKKIKKI